MDSNNKLNSSPKDNKDKSLKFSHDFQQIKKESEDLSVTKEFDLLSKSDCHFQDIHAIENINDINKQIIIEDCNAEESKLQLQQDDQQGNIQQDNKIVEHISNNNEQQLTQLQNNTFIQEHQVEQEEKPLVLTQREESNAQEEYQDQCKDLLNQNDNIRKFKFNSESHKHQSIKDYLSQGTYGGDDGGQQVPPVNNYLNSKEGQQEILAFLKQQTAFIEKKMGNAVDNNKIILSNKTSTVDPQQESLNEQDDPDLFKIQIAVLIAQSSQRDQKNIEKFLYKKLKANQLKPILLGNSKGQGDDYLEYVPQHQLNNFGIQPVQNTLNYEAFYFVGKNYIPQQYFQNLHYPGDVGKGKYIIFMNCQDTSFHNTSYPLQHKIIFIKEPWNQKQNDLELQLQKTDVCLYKYTCQNLNCTRQQEDSNNNLVSQEKQQKSCENCFDQELSKHYYPNQKCKLCGTQANIKKYYIFKHRLSDIEDESLDYKYYNLRKQENLQIISKFICACLNKDRFSDDSIAGKLIIGIKDNPPVGMSQRIICEGLDFTDTEFEHFKNGLHKVIQKSTTLYQQDPKNCTMQKLTEQIFQNHFELKKCDIIHYEPKNKHNNSCDNISELYQYCPYDKKFSKKCIVELTIKRISVTVQDPVILFNPESRNNTQIFCQRILDSSTKMTDANDLQKTHPNKVLLHKDNNLNFIIRNNINFDKENKFYTYVTVSQGIRIKIQDEKIRELEQENKQLQEKLQNMCYDSSSDQSDNDDSASNFDFGNIFDQQLSKKQETQLQQQNQQISIKNLSNKLQNATRDINDRERLQKLRSQRSRDEMPKTHSEIVSRIRQCYQKIRKLQRQKRMLKPLKWYQKIHYWFKQDPLGRSLFIFTIISYLLLRKKLK